MTSPGFFAGPASTPSSTDDTGSDARADTGKDTGSESQDDTDSTTAQDLPIEEIIAQTHALQDFEALLVTTKVSEDMQSPPYAVFAPWDYALERLPYWEEMTRDRAWWGHLRDLTLGHIHQGNLPYDLGLELRTIACTRADETLQETWLDEVDEEFALNGILYPIDALTCTTIN